MSKSVFHDLKADRPDLAPPLPSLLMALPVLAYLSVFAAAGLGSFFIYKKGAAEKATQSHRDLTLSEDAQTADISQQMKTINDESARAAEVAQWMNTTKPLSYILAEVTNSIVDPNTIAGLKMTRRENNPDWVDMTIVFNSGGAAQIDKTSKKIESLGYQAAAEDTKGGREANGASTYTATWAPTLSATR